MGDVNTLIYLVQEGALDDLPEAQQRGIVATGFNSAADLRDKQASQGLHPKASWEDPEFALATANYSSNQRARATEVLWNPEGVSLKEQLKRIFEKK